MQKHAPSPQNSTGEEVKYRSEVNITISVFLDDITTAGKKAEQIRKGTNNCVKMEKERKISFGLKKTKYMIVKTERE